MTSLLEQYLDHVHRQTCFRSGTMKLGKVRATLLREQGFNGEVMPRHVYAEKRVAARDVEIDRRRARYINTETGTFLDFCDVTVGMVDYTEWLMNRKDAA